MSYLGAKLTAEPAKQKFRGLGFYNGVVIRNWQPEVDFQVLTDFAIMEHCYRFERVPREIGWSWREEFLVKTGNGEWGVYEEGHLREILSMLCLV